MFIKCYFMITTAICVFDYHGAFSARGCIDSRVAKFKIIETICVILPDVPDRWAFCTSEHTCIWLYISRCTQSRVQVERRKQYRAGALSKSRRCDWSYISSFWVTVKCEKKEWLPVPFSQTQYAEFSLQEVILGSTRWDTLRGFTHFSGAFIRRQTVIVSTDKVWSQRSMDL